MGGLEKRSPGEPEFHQTVREFVETVMPYHLDHGAYQKALLAHA